MDITAVGTQSMTESDCRKVCLSYHENSKRNKGYYDASQESLMSTKESEVNQSEPPVEILFQGSQGFCGDSKAFDPTNLSEFEHEKMVKLFKQKAAIAYLISVGCTTHQSLKDMTQYVLENEEPPPFKPKTKDELLKPHTHGKSKKHKHKHCRGKSSLDEQGSNPTETNLKDNNVERKVKIPQHIGNDAIHPKLVPKDFHRDSHRRESMAFNAFSESTVQPKQQLVRRNLREKKVKETKVVKKEVLRTKVLLPPLDEVGRKEYKDKVTKYYHIEINPKNVQTEKQRQEYREQCRKRDVEWRKYISKWGLYFPYSGFLHLRHKAIKELENSRMAPGMYFTEEYDEIQRKRKLGMQKGFDKGVPRFLVKDEFNHITPFSYGDGTFKYEKYMKNNGNARSSNFSQASRFPYRSKSCDASVAVYDIPSSLDSLLKSGKGVYYPKGGFPYNKRYPQSYISAGYNTGPKEINPRSNGLNFLRDCRIAEEHSGMKATQGMVSELNQRYNQYKGKFRKLSSKAHEKPLEETPGPGSYDFAKKPPVRMTKEEEKRIQERAKLKKNHRPKEEMANVDYMPTEDYYLLADVYNSESIGPGSYDIAGSLTKLNGFPGRFKEGPPQRPSLDTLKVLDERLRGKDIPLEEKLAKASL